MKFHDTLDREHALLRFPFRQSRKLGSSALTHVTRPPEGTPNPLESLAADETPTDVVVPLEGWDLIHPPANANDPTYLLADSLAHLRDPELSEKQKDEIREIVQHDAEALASQLLPADKVEELNLPHPDTLDESLQNGFRTSNEETPPMLRDVILLVRAFDETGDPKIKGAVKLIFDSMPPSASEELREAYVKALKNGTRIMREYGDISIAKINEKNPRERATEEFFRIMRTAHLKKQQDVELKPSDNEPDATIPPGMRP